MGSRSGVMEPYILPIQVIVGLRRFKRRNDAMSKKLVGLLERQVSRSLSFNLEGVKVTGNDDIREDFLRFLKDVFFPITARNMRQE